MTFRVVFAGIACAAVFVSCKRSVPERSEPPTPRKAGLAIAETFETSEPYSSRKISERDLTKFFAKHAEYRNDSASIADFYERRNMQSAWILGDSLSASAESFIAYAATGHSTAGHDADFPAHLSELYEQSAMGQGATLCDGCAPDLELHLTAEFFHFADRKYGGHLTRDMRELNWFIPRAKKDASRLIDSLALGKTDISPYEPIHPQYELLKRGIERYAKSAKESWTPLELPGRLKKLASGDTASVISVVGRRLYLLGDYDRDSTGILYDSTLVMAVQRFQERHGLHADGVIDAAFLRALNVPVSQRLRTMLVNIERLRWVPEQQPANLLLVNIPEFRLHVFEDGKLAMSMEVVVGARATRTVIFSDTLTQIVFSPGWTVPPGIARNEVIPAMNKDRNYLAKHDMEIIGGTKEAPIIRQRPGPANPLGGAKFLFPNSYDIYLHDTPARSLFANEQRANSHGCIRVSRAKDLAVYLLQNDPAWSAERIGEAMRSGKETTVALQTKRPVTIGYFTAWVDPEGRLNFRDDVYGHDARLFREMFVTAVSPAAASPATPEKPSR